MDNSSSAICNMNREFVVDEIMSRLDGPTLAASACACSDLHAAASNQNLWKNLCSAMWPSTTKSAAAVEALTDLGFDKFYADAFPLILCQQEGTTKSAVAHASSSDLASFVDIYYKGKCILSKALDTIPETVNANNNDDNTNKDNNEGCDELRQWLLYCPFRLDLLPSYDDTDINPTNDHDEIMSPGGGGSDDCVTYLQSLTCSIETRKRGLDLRDELAEDIRLSWILFDKKNGKAVNLSSWKPTLVRKSWAPDWEYVFQFGSVVPVEGTGHRFAECKIVARCQLISNSGYAKWTEISMRVEDMVGAHLNTSKSLGVFNQALHSKRSAKHLEVERANLEYKMYKKEMKRRHDRREYLVDKLYALVGLTVLLAISYVCTTVFH